MKKKVINSIELILQIVAIALLFVRGMFLVVAKDTYSRFYSFADVCSDGDNKFIFIALIVLFIVNVVICLISIISKNTKKDNILHIIVPILSLIIIFVSVAGMQDVSISNISLFTEPDVMDAVVRGIEPLFYITCGLLLLVVILSFIKRSSLIISKNVEQPQQVINNIQETSNADELKKYKDLLDSGVITQEEFDQKKKQLLGL